MEAGALDSRARARPPFPIVDAEMSTPPADDITRILDEQALTPVYQPIVHLRSGEIFGYEGLIRGPEGSALHSPARLFDAAHRAGRLPELEWLCCRKVIDGYFRLALRPRLFVNVSPQTVASAAQQNRDLVQALGHRGNSRERIVVELTEHEQVRDVEYFRRAMASLRQHGFGVALDDLGEGFSSLRLWSEIRPDFVKIDMYFVQGVHADPLKFQFLKSLQQIAENCGSALVAEGIEGRADLTVLRDLGVSYGQGYLIARPAATPITMVDASLRGMLDQRAIAVFPEMSTLAGRASTARRLLLPVTPVAPESNNDEVFARFEAKPELAALPVVSEGAPRGLISRHRFIAGYARPYRKELYGRRPCTVLMDPSPVLVGTEMSLRELSELLIGVEARHLGEGFIITGHGRYAGMGSAQDLIREITRMQMEAARYANPLTLLPGNVPIDAHMERLLAAGQSFVAAYCDINHFKPFNDAYGYRRGDDMIKLAAAVLSRACDSSRDFLGHIGGDDFILLLQSDDWEARCQRAVDTFGAETAPHFDPEDLERGGVRGEDRQGNAIVFPLASLAVGVVRADASEFHSHLEVSAAAAEAKKHAKRLGGNVVFVERRKPA
jgi:EAL domain-containing protein (putative c-di-GMP-specific phosphodiesterase class I)/GGDEF domain-containing protein